MIRLGRRGWPGVWPETASRSGSAGLSCSQNAASSNVLPLKDMIRYTMSIRCQVEK